MRFENVFFYESNTFEKPHDVCTQNTSSASSFRVPHRVKHTRRKGIFTSKMMRISNVRRSVVASNTLNF